jgi:hypothetical protein
MSTGNQLHYCRMCRNRKEHPTFGIICGLTDSKPDFTIECMKFSLDESKAEQFIKQDNISDECSDRVIEGSLRSGCIQRLAHALRLLLKKEVNHNSSYH